MTALEEKLMEQLKKLPQHKVAEVIDFVEFLTVREERAAAAQRLKSNLSKLDLLGLPDVSEDEVAIEVMAVRKNRRQFRSI
jgi:hypothetical protein